MTFTEPRNMSLAIAVMGWDDKKVNEKVVDFLQQGYPFVYPWMDKNHHETENMNAAIRVAEKSGYRYWHMANDDVEYRYPETIPAMYDWIETHPDVGAIHPWVQGEDADPHAVPYESYLQDGTGLTLRLDLNGWLPQFDEEYLATGWAELDLGYEMEWRGWKIPNDRRYPVKHDKTNSNRQDKKTFLMAVSRRNRLILTVKWDIVGRDKWQGVEAYNQSVPTELKIPTFFELMNMTTEDQETFWRSCHPEHPTIWKWNGKKDPNLIWKNPLVVGYSTRELWEQGQLEVV